MATTHYKVLGVDETASDDEIRKAFRKLSLEHHPDRNVDNPNYSDTLYKNITLAYDILGDKDKRAEYDASLRPGPSGPHFFFGGGGGGAPTAEDIFQMLFQQHHNAQMYMRPMPIIKSIDITLEQAYTGCTVPFEIERWSRMTHSTEKNTYMIDIKPGVESGECIILREMGNVLENGNAGDVKISINVLNNTVFERRGVDIYMNWKITLKEALCGFSFEIKHLNGKTFTINSRFGQLIHPGYKKIIPEMGMKRDTVVGNMVITFDILFPTALEAETIQTLKELLP